MEAGRDLDARVAEKVMGWKTNDTGHYETPYGGWAKIPEFSENILSAWRVVEKLAEKDISVRLTEVIPSSDAIVWEVQFYGAGVGAYACEMEPAHAICLAALKAVGVETTEAN